VILQVTNLDPAVDRRVARHFDALLAAARLQHVQ
jgi:hypothetical protein